MMETQRAEHGQTRAGQALHLGIVHGVRSVHFIAAAPTRAALIRRLAEYVESQADAQLYAEDAGLLAGLVAAGAEAAAVRFYFERVGERWDREWLDEARLDLADGRASAAW